MCLFVLSLERRLGDRGVRMGVGKDNVLRGSFLLSSEVKNSYQKARRHETSIRYLALDGDVGKFGVSMRLFG